MTCCEKWQNLVTSGWTYINPNTSAATKIRYQSPLQGSWYDCPFVAALTSIIWVHPKFIKNLGTNPPLTYSFCDENPQSPCPNFVCSAVIDTNLLVQTIGTPPSFCGGKSKNQELWFSLYEMAYAKFCLYKKGKMTLNQLATAGFWPYNPAPAGDPLSPCTLTGVEWGGNPATVMARLAGRSANTQNMYVLVKGFPDWTQLLVNDIFAVVSNHCKNSKTDVPMVAWTYPAESGIVPGSSPPVTKKYIPDGYHYADDGIHANHSYSILGNFVDENNIKYIILRATSGNDPTNSGLAGKIYAGTTYWAPYNSYYKICPTLITNPLGLQYEFATRATNIAFPNGLGIFALKADEFKNYFEGFGWLDAPPDLPP